MQIDRSIFNDKEKLLAVAIERSQKFHVLKFKSVLSKLLVLDKQGYFKYSKQNFLEALSRLRAEEVLLHASDFFWLSLHRLYNAFDAIDQKVAEIMFSFFLQNAFDSFYVLLPNSSYLQCENFGDGKIMFIKLKLALESHFDKEIILEKVDNSTLKYSLDLALVEFTETACLINLDNPPCYFQIEQGLINNNIFILYQRHQNLFELDYIFECCENPFLGSLLKGKIEKALNKIQLNDSQLFNEIVKSLDYIVPIGNDVKDNPPSFASAMLKKSIFLSLDLLISPEHFILETFIHEYSHCELHYIQDTILLTRIENNILEYYSPWRNDPRPLLGLIHGIYVSHNLINFYYKFWISDKNSQVEKGVIFDRAEVLINQVSIAFKQIKKHQLSQFSEELLSRINSNTIELANSFSIDITTPPRVIIEHKENWIKNNKVDIEIRE